MSTHRARYKFPVPAALATFLFAINGVAATLMVTPTLAQEAKPTIHYISGPRADAPIPRPGMVLVKGQVAGPLDMEKFAGSGADWLEPYKPFINDGKTVVTSPHKVFGPQTNDLVLQLRKAGVTQVVLAGMSANLCVESHMRDLLEEGFHVVIAADATAAAQFPRLRRL